MRTKRIRAGFYRLGPYDILRTGWHQWSIYRVDFPDDDLPINRGYLADCRPTKALAVEAIAEDLAWEQANQP